MTTTTKEPTIDRTTRRGTVAFYHRTASGSGSAMRLEMKDGTTGNNGCLFLEMALQKTQQGGEPGNGVFDWENKVTVKLNFSDLCEILAVLDGIQARAGGERNGIYHETSETNTLITFGKSEKRPGYYLGISRKAKSGEQQFKGHIILSPVEATGLCHVLRSTAFHITFGQIFHVAAAAL